MKICIKPILLILLLDVVSRFEFISTTNGIETDSDGDMIVPRKNSKLNKKSYIDIGE